jgi:ATP-dependent DNA helicase UvrD/PcrA
VIRPKDWRPQGIDDLEPAAWDALRHEGSICVVAGPGAGKTEFLAQKATYLLQTNLCPPPSRILAISFKTDAADNLGRRVRRRCPPEQAARFLSITFDSFTKSLVDRFFPAIEQDWRPSRPYEIKFPNRRVYDDFLTRSRLNAPTQWQREVAGLSTDTFEPKFVGGTRLSIPPAEPVNGTTFAIRRWWDEGLGDRNPSHLTFVQINRIAELLLRRRPTILRALRATYPFVFLDEFQDTTYAQYDFLLTMLLGSGAAITAVGDDKQRIMVWAGARPDSFTRFEKDFDAGRTALLFNHRSSPGMVRVQYIVASALDNEAPEPLSKVEAKIDGDVAEVWTFGSEAREAEQLAMWIAADMKSRGLLPRDYALLVRQTPDRFEDQFASPFANAGLRLRNENRRIGQTTLQDMLAEEVTRIFLAILDLALRLRAPEAWSLATKALSDLRGMNPNDASAQQRVENDLKFFLSELRGWVEKSLPSEETSVQLVQRVLSFVDLAALARVYPSYGTGETLSIATEAIMLYFKQCAANADDWINAVSEFEGKEQIPLMTIHKSKGLEYDSILFVGLDDRMWWSHKSGDYEGRATFFVGLSRAKQRVIFTYCKARGTRKAVGDLYELLSAAGAPERVF